VLSGLDGPWHHINSIMYNADQDVDTMVFPQRAPYRSHRQSLQEADTQLQGAAAHPPSFQTCRYDTSAPNAINVKPIPGRPYTFG
jgi:hypothetical protein